QSHLSNILSFHAHQCVEKSLKAVIEKYSTEPQKTHNLERLYYQVEKFVQLHIDELMLEKVSELYIESRYPGDLGLLPNGKPDAEDVREFYEFARDVYQRICDLLMDK
ncbi:MAG: HEPN domain-containing protein, partial [Pseudomonadota bacterium]|nr:HEPN domain-containing protein [Pseudomonadota bacterium]